VTDLNLTAAIEEAARCLWEDVFTGDDMHWAKIDDPVVRNGLLADAERLVTAVLPLVREQTAREVAQLAEQFTNPDEWRDYLDAVKDAVRIVRGEVSVP
jgi:hypothetical protein